MNVKMLKAVVFVNCLWPLAFMLYDAKTGALGPNPIDYVTRATGTMTLLFLALTLLVTPLRQLTGWNVLTKLRRMIGLYAFFYGTLHLATWVAWDQEFRFADMVHDAIARNFITVGLLAWIFMVPLAITSTSGMVRRLGGKRWRALHRATYLCAGLGVLHFYLVLKVPNQKLWNYAAVVAVLLAIRVAVALFKKKTAVQSQVRARP